MEIIDIIIAVGVIMMPFNNNLCMPINKESRDSVKRMTDNNTIQIEFYKDIVDETKLSEEKALVFSIYDSLTPTQPKLAVFPEMLRPEHEQRPIEKIKSIVIRAIEARSQIQIFTEASDSKPELSIFFNMEIRDKLDKPIVIDLTKLSLMKIENVTIMWSGANYEDGLLIGKVGVDLPHPEFLILQS